ncbi:MAG: universal stress protein [Chloroflexi bacterium]|nr:MAG: universal stress protein [Chloroflexota bacterium]RLC66390.1 MAG: universal stress protein [Chloroflexota bacterium]RLC90805.1 MAG: universal stress protein [Chloroflexota bacterium]
MFKKLLVAVDGSSHSKRAVGAAIDLAKRYQASVYLLHVIRDLSLPKEILEMIAAGEVTESRMEILQDSAEIILENAQERFKQAGLSDVKSGYVIGDPALKIADWAEQNDADLIVIGHRGLGTRGEMLGSVTRKLLNITKTSCLVVR